MNKIFASLMGLVLLAGCNTYDYYEGGVRYTQDGPDCIYYSGEQGHRFNNDIYSLENGKKIVYRNTICAQLYDKDNAGAAPRADRQVLAPAAVAPTCPCANGGCNAVRNVEYTPTFGCSTCGMNKPVVTRKYYVVSGM